MQPVGKGCCFMWATFYCLWGSALTPSSVRPYTIKYSNDSSGFCGSHCATWAAVPVRDAGEWRKILVHSRCSLHAPLLIFSLLIFPASRHHSTSSTSSSWIPSGHYCSNNDVPTVLPAFSPFVEKCLWVRYQWEYKQIHWDQLICY